MGIGGRRLVQAICRQRLHLPDMLSASIIYKVAETRSELEQALSLMNENARGSTPLTPFHLLPTTTILIGVAHGRVIAACTLVRDSVLGLPMDSAFDLARYRKSGERVVEVSSLLIASEFERKNRGALHSFIRFLWRYSLYYHGTNRLLIAVAPAEREFYEAIYLFQADVPVCGVKQGKLIGLQTLLDDSMLRFKKIYNEKSDEQNLYRFMATAPLAHEFYPERMFYTVNDATWTPAMFQYFRRQHRELENSISAIAASQIQSAYDRLGLRSVFNGQESTRADRARHDVCCPIKIVVQNELGQNMLEDEMTVFNVSLGGMRVRLSADGELFSAISMRLGTALSATVQVGPGLYSNLRIVPVWKLGSGHVGFQISQSDAVWCSFIGQIESANERRLSRNVV